ncbi:MAG TPA: phosphoglycerate kinase, partial [Patescibacteria group bacterium]|nr:phosphoglycerate kinase [Patescibacteria group bacterium]
MKLKALKASDIKNKVVFLRLDLDVDFENGKMEDFRLVQTLGTVEFCLKSCSKLLIAGHLGRPNEVQNKLSLEPIVLWFAQKLGKIALKSNRGRFPGWEIGERVFLFENLRFFKEEEKNDKEFAKDLAKLAEIYVNDAFADSHRNHASIAAIAKLLPHFAGLHLQKEVSELSKVI